MYHGRYYTTETEDTKHIPFQFIRQRKPMGQKRAARTQQVKAMLKRFDAGLKGRNDAE